MTAQPQVRRASPDDGPAVRAIFFDGMREFGVTPEIPGLDEEIMHFGEPDPDVDAFVAVLDGAPIGSVMISRREDERGWLSKFFVDGRHRGRGVGRALLAKAVEAARARGLHTLGLDTRGVMKAAIHLYEATGWRLDPDVEPHGPCELYYMLALDAVPQG